MDIFVARQPIFDRRRNTVAYELLFRSGMTNAFGQNDPNKASIQMMDTTLQGFGLDSLVGDKQAYFNASRDVLVKEHWAVLPPERSVIEVLENITPTPRSRPPARGSSGPASGWRSTTSSSGRSTSCCSP